MISFDKHTQIINKRETKQVEEAHTHTHTHLTHTQTS